MIAKLKQKNLNKVVYKILLTFLKAIGIQVIKGGETRYMMDGIIASLCGKIPT